MDESLKWGEPSWRPRKGGSTLRMSWNPDRPERMGLFVHCQSDLLGRVQSIYPDAFDYAGNRALYTDLLRPAPQHAIAHVAEMVFTYHSAKTR